MSLQLLFDENSNGRILRGLKRELPDIELLTVHDVGLQETDDPEILAWAAENNLVLVSHDENTVTDYAYRRMKNGEWIAGVVIVPQDLAIGQAIEELKILIECSEQDEYENKVVHIPL
jgi:predicted nuclease of predicted toxin-antitoxin system